MLAQPAADEIDVACHVGCREVREDPLVEGEAAADVAQVLADEIGHLEVVGRRERVRVDALGLLIDLAVDRRRALAGPARVHRNDVEALVEAGAVGLAAELEAISGAGARASEVDEQRADPVCLVDGR
jgi:hypothetical protein